MIKMGDKNLYGNGIQDDKKRMTGVVQKWEWGPGWGQSTCTSSRVQYVKDKHWVKKWTV